MDALSGGGRRVSFYLQVPTEVIHGAVDGVGTVGEYAEVQVVGRAAPSPL